MTNGDSCLQKRVRIVIAGGDSWYSRGDDAILAGTLKMLREKYADNLEVTVLTEIPLVTKSRFPQVNAIYRKNFLAVAKEMRNADLLLWGGGQLIQNISSQVFMIFQLSILAIAHLLHLPIMGFGLGVAELKGRFWQKLVAFWINRLAQITVRDERSRADLAAWGGKKHIRVTADPALVLEPQSEELQNKKNKKRVVISPRTWFHYSYSFFPDKNSRLSALTSHKLNHLLTTLAKVADWCVSTHDADIYFVPMYPGKDQGDEQVSMAIIQKMESADRAKILSQNILPQELVDFFQSVDVVLSMRLHAAILAACGGAPSVMVYTQIKGLSFLERLGIAKHAYPVDKYNFEDICKSMEEILASPDTYRSQVLAQMCELRNLAYQNIDVLSGIIDERQIDN